MHDAHCVLTMNADAVSAKVSTVLSVLQLVHFVVKIRSLAGARTSTLCFIDELDLRYIARTSQGYKHFVFTLD